MPRKSPCYVVFSASARSWTCIMLEIQAYAAEDCFTLWDREMLNSFLWFLRTFFSCNPVFWGGGQCLKCFPGLWRCGQSWHHYLVNVIEVGFASAGGIQQRLHQACKELDKCWASVPQPEKSWESIVTPCPALLLCPLYWSGHPAYLCWCCIRSRFLLPCAWLGKYLLQTGTRIA